jgi:hypothetical protein
MSSFSILRKVGKYVINVDTLLNTSSGAVLVVTYNLDWKLRAGISSRYMAVNQPCSHPTRM